MDSISTDTRSISPVVGVVLLVAVVVALSAVAAGIFLGLADEQDPAPTVSMSLADDAGGIGERGIHHEQGDRLDGDRVRIRGVADPETLAGTDLAGGETHVVWPVDETLAVVWEGDDESYLLREFEVDPTALLPAPDEGCSWVDSETNSGTDSITIDGLVVDCDVVTDEVVEVRNGGTVIGDTESRLKELDADDARFYGAVEVETVANVQNGTITGSVRSYTADVKLLDRSSVNGSVRGQKVVEVIDSSVAGDATSNGKTVKVTDGRVDGAVTAGGKADVENGTVGGSVAADAKQAEITAGSSVGGDVVSDDKGVTIDDSTVAGSVTGDGTVSLQDATVEGHVYADAADFSCTNSTINGDDCGDYSPRDPDDY